MSSKPIMFLQSCLPRRAGWFGDGELHSESYDDDDGIYSGSNIRSVLKMDPSTGALRIPSYTQLSRAEHCPLLKHTWGQNWEKVIKLCASQPWRTLHKTKYSGRTALHLATFDRRCPLGVARALLKANRQMIAVRDSNNYTPLHIVAFFSAANTIARGAGTGLYSDETERPAEDAVAINHMGRTTEGIVGRAEITEPIPSSRTIIFNAIDAEAETMSIVSLFCDTAIMVEQELGRALGKNQEEKQLPLLEGTSPLYLAAKKGAPVSILKILLETRSRTNWIAPSTGGEPYWYRNDNSIHGKISLEKEVTSDSFSSPLEILLREDRLRSTMNASYYRNDVYLLGEEEDGNMLRRGRTRNSDQYSSSTAAAFRLRNGTTCARRTPLHPDEIDGVPHLMRLMRKMAIDRCREHHCHENCGVANRTVLNGPSTYVADCDSCIATPGIFTQSQQRCLQLWERCIELLVTAGGGGIPLLLMEEDDHTNKKATMLMTTNHSESSFVPYGILHACVCCKVPVPSLVEIALLLFPEQVTKRDARHGLIPLHHVLRAKHKYSYATSNLLTILLKGRANVFASLCSKTNRKAKKQQLRQSSKVARGVVSKNGKMPEIPSLSHCTTYNSESDMNNIPTSQFLTPRYLHSTVLLPFPSMPNNYVLKPLEGQPLREDTGPIPLIFAIRLGLPMDGIIDKLLEADSYESLRTLDPISRLPPFALLAMSVCPFVNQQQCTSTSSNLDKSSDSNRKITPSSRKEYANDIVSTAIGCTINALSHGDGDTNFETLSLPTKHTPSTSMSTSSICSASIGTNPKNSIFKGPTYKLDDIYRLLLAHPQVLAQYFTVS